MRVIISTKFEIYKYHIVLYTLLYNIINKRATMAFISLTFANRLKAVFSNFGRETPKDHSYQILTESNKHGFKEEKAFKFLR